MPKKIPMRRCMGCNEQREKKDLIRIVRTPEEKIVLDRTGRMNGRGAYICNDPECLKKVEKKKSLNRAFKMPVPQEVYGELAAQMESTNG